MPELGDRYPLLLEEVAAQMRANLEEQGYPSAQAAAAAERVAEHLRKFLGGTWQYIPKGYHYDLDRRDREIYEKFNGRNQTELCDEYGITRVRLYQILQQVRAELRARRREGVAP